MSRRLRCGVMAVLFAVAAWDAAGREDAPELKVSGYGFVGDLRIKRLLKLLDVEKTNRFYSANFIEDSVVVMMSDMQRNGYLHPEIIARVTLEDGGRTTFRWKDTLGEPLPRPIHATSLHFRIHEGVRFHYRTVRIEGLDARTMDNEAALNYFMDTRGIFKVSAHRIFTPDKAKSSASSLAEALERKGFPSATVTLTNLVQDPQSGEVDLTVQVQQGIQHVVRSVRIDEFQNGRTNLIGTVAVSTNQPYSQLWLQDFAQRLRRRHFKAGYPDTKVAMTVLRSNAADVITLDMQAQVVPGRRIQVGEIRFLGEDKTKERVMRARVPLHTGDLLNPIEAEQGRFRLARLGVFETVEVRYDQKDARTRDVIYDVHEGKELDFNLLAGFGSYELLRGGFELDQYNMWGLAHNSRLKMVQSFKASSGEYTYTIPQFRWGSDLFFNASGLQREEIDFTRQEVAASVGARRRFEPISTDASLRYSYQYLNAADAGFVPGFGVPDARVAAMILDLRHDRLDNPITPRTGYKVFSNFEVASSALGGEVDYQRVELHGAYHLPISRDRWLHFGAAHGAVVTVGGSRDNLPFNKRFFPGGASSIRGYQEGEAAPRNAAGKLIGAESYLGLTAELEQALTPKWSLVGFFDAMGLAQEIGNYPFNELLYSVGGGVRWNTVIGPVRLEYGHNLRRRPHDPSGTVQVSIGFPF